MQLTTPSSRATGVSMYPPLSRRVSVARTSSFAALLLTAIALLLAVAVRGAPAPAKSGDLDGGEHMVTLSATTFGPDVAKDMTLVEFYSPWCGHCKKFAPTYKNIAEIQEHWAESGFKIRRVNCVASGDLCGEQKVTGYPSLFLYRDGQIVEKYKGDRSFEDLMSFTTARASDYRKERERKIAAAAAA